MCRIKSGAICATLASALWLTGCVSAATKAEKAEIKRATVQRWTACLERNADVGQMPSTQVEKLMSQDCEGHKRDVLALYPRNMASQVDQMLASSAYRFIESMNENKDAASQSHGQVQTVLR